jgi:hypothetical protein
VAGDEQSDASFRQTVFNPQAHVPKRANAPKPPIVSANYSMVSKGVGSGSANKCEESIVSCVP